MNYMKTYYCIEENCNNIVSKKNVRCNYCSNIGINNPNFKNGKYSKEKIRTCKECDKIISCGSKLGYCQSCCKKGERSVNFNKSMKKETKKKISNSLKGDKHPYYDKKRPLHSKKMQGSLNPNYIDGGSFEEYSQDFTEKLKREIRKRDNYTCQNCGMTQEEHYIVYGSNVEIHHIDYNKKNCEKNNLITLCKSCNVRANYNRSYWQEFYKGKVKIYV